LGRLPNSDKHAELTGAKKKDPQRYRNQGPQNLNAIGEPPKVFSLAQKQVWYELIENSPPEVLTKADSIIVEILAVLLNELREVERCNRNANRELSLWQKKLIELIACYDNQQSPEDQKKTMKLIQHQFRREPILSKFPTSRFTAITSIMARMGMTPLDRTKFISLDVNSDSLRHGIDDYETH
jgi:hypothetical protein